MADAKEETSPEHINLKVKITEAFNFWSEYLVRFKGGGALNVLLSGKFKQWLNIT